KSVRLSAGLSASVDLADGHVDVAADDLSLPARGPALTVGHVWDSALSQAGAAGQGWQTRLTPRMGGGLTSTISYADATGAVWLFPYTGAPTAPAPYTTYQTPASLPDTISFSWAQAGPISASDGLARLNQLWNRLNNRQRRERRQA